MKNCQNYKTFDLAALCEPEVRHQRGKPLTHNGILLTDTAPHSRPQQFGLAGFS